MTHPKPIFPPPALLNRLFEEAVRLHGADWKKVVSHVKVGIDALDAGNRAAIDRAFERLLAPDFRRGLLN